MTQEFVTLPREVVEQAIDALYCTDSEEGSPAYNFELKAIKELRAALEQPQVEQETAPNGATHIQPQQGAFYKRVDEKWYVWSRMEDGRPHRWYISPGTVESCLKPISAATEQPQNHVPDAGNMVPDGWKLVPVKPTQEMLDAYIHMQGRFSSARSDWAAMLAAAPQPPTTVDSSVVQLQGKQQPVAEVIESHVRAGLDGRFTAVVAGRERLSVGAEIFVHPQPKREPLTVEQIAAATGAKPGTPTWPLAVAFTRSIEAAHNIK